MPDAVRMWGLYDDALDAFVRVDFLPEDAVRSCERINRLKDVATYRVIPGTFVPDADTKKVSLADIHALEIDITGGVDAADFIAEMREEDE